MTLVKIEKKDLEKPLNRRIIEAILGDLLPEHMQRRQAAFILAGFLVQGKIPGYFIMDGKKKVGVVVIQEQQGSVTGSKVLYINAMAVPLPKMTPQAWDSLFLEGKRVAREMGCSMMVWDTDKQAVIDASRYIGAAETHRFVVEV